MLLMPSSVHCFKVAQMHLSDPSKQLVVAPITSDSRLQGPRIRSPWLYLPLYQLIADL